MHRDISIRNVLLTVDGNVKLGDFGLARFLQPGEDAYIMNQPGRLSVRHMAPESFVNRSFNFASDVWAFGVCMWEIMKYETDDAFIQPLTTYIVSATLRMRLWASR